MSCNKNLIAGKVNKVGAGRPSVLMLTEEREIVVTCQVLQELGYGLTRNIVTDVVTKFLKDSHRKSPFKDGIPGPDWWEGFLHRWPSLSQRKPQHLSAKRASAVSSATLHSWFSTVEGFLKKISLLKRTGPVADFSSRIWNADETGFCLGSTSKKILARRGARCVHEVGGASDHQFITVNVCGNAAGLKLPPFILYKGKHLYNTWTEGGPAAACYGVSQSGWMEEANYLKWFEMQFHVAVKHLLETGPIVLFFDGHYSHMSISLIQTARRLGVHLFCLPPNTTHVLQPLDVGVFGPMKQQWRTILKDYKLTTGARNITKERFPGLVKQLWMRSITQEHLRAAFRAVGLVPFNPLAVKPEHVAPSLDSVDSEATPLQGEFTATLTLHCKETPIRAELRGYFRDVLRPAHEGNKSQRRRRVEMSCVGEVLTSDEVVQRIERANEERAAKKRSKKKKGKHQRMEDTEAAAETDDTYCEKCSEVYTEEEADSWIGCDNCDSWWHYWCADLCAMLSEKDEWLCEHCQTQ